MNETSDTRGRPAATSHAEIERAAFRLFGRHGFDETTLDMIATKIGVSRRTVTRYYPSKNDIPWGQFDDTLTEFRRVLAEAPTDIPLWERVHRAVLSFNTFPDNAVPSHSDRMRLILNTPALQAHSVHRYAQWRRIIAEYVASHTGQLPSDPLPQLTGRISLSLVISAYEQWLSGSPGRAGTPRNADLLSGISQMMDSLRIYLASDMERDVRCNASRSRTTSTRSHKGA